MYPSRQAIQSSSVGRFFLVTSQREMGPYHTYDEALMAARQPCAILHGLDPRKAYCVVDRSETGED